MDEAEQAIQLYYAEAKRQSKSLRKFLNAVVIDSRPPTRLKLLLENNPWQKELYSLLVPMFELAGGIIDQLDKKAIFVTAPRGHSKTSSIAILCAWLLIYAKNTVSVSVAAADKEQAHILLERIEREICHNPWLTEELKVEKNRVIGPKGILTVLASDAPTASGLLDDVIILDELVYHKSRDLFDILHSGRHKRPNGVFIIISNAGVIGSWQWHLWKAAKESSQWLTHEIPAFSAAWLDTNAIKEERRLQPGTVFKRLHENQWCPGTEDNAAFTREQIQLCQDRTTAAPPNKDHEHIACIDFGITKDRTALAVMHREGGDGTIVLDKLTVWQGSREARTPLSMVEEWIKQQMTDYNIVRVVLDVYQLEQLAQRLERLVEVERVTCNGNTLQKLSENFRSLVLNKRFGFYPGSGLLPMPNGTPEDLADELEGLVIVEKLGGWRIEHTEEGHNDRYIVCAMGAYTLVRLATMLECKVLIVDSPGEFNLDQKEDPYELDRIFG